MSLHCMSSGLALGRWHQFGDVGPFVDGVRAFASSVWLRSGRCRYWSLVLLRCKIPTGTPTFLHLTFTLDPPLR